MAATEPLLTRDNVDAAYASVLRRIRECEDRDEPTNRLARERDEIILYKMRYVDEEFARRERTRRMWEDVLVTKVEVIRPWWREWLRL